MNGPDTPDSDRKNSPHKICSKGWVGPGHLFLTGNAVRCSRGNVMYYTIMLVLLFNTVMLVLYYNVMTLQGLGPLGRQRCDANWE